MISSFIDFVPCLFADAERDKLIQSNGKFAQYLCKILEVYFSYHHEAYSMRGLFTKMP